MTELEVIQILSKNNIEYHNKSVVILYDVITQDSIIPQLVSFFLESECRVAICDNKLGNYGPNRSIMREADIVISLIKQDNNFRSVNSPNSKIVDVYNNLTVVGKDANRIYYGE